MLDLTRSLQYYSEEEWLGVEHVKVAAWPGPTPGLPTLRARLSATQVQVLAAHVQGALQAISLPVGGAAVDSCSRRTLDAHGDACMQVPMQGHGAVPTPESINTVSWLCMRWQEENPDKYIVVHCTHGFNRTGAPPVHAASLCCLPARSRAAGHKTCASYAPAALFRFTVLQRSTRSTAHPPCRLCARQPHDALDARPEPGRRCGDFRQGPAARHIQGAVPPGLV